MNLPKEFDFYTKEGIAKKCSIDKPRAGFLIKESGLSLEGLNERLEKIGINRKNSNSIIKDCYDIVMELARALLLLKGYNAVGLYAHEAEVSYLKKLGFLDNEISFLNELRHFRNSVIYYGEILDEEYAEKAVNFTKKVYPKLKALCEEAKAVNKNQK